MSTGIWDGRSETRPDSSVFRAPDAADWRQITKEVQQAQAASLDSGVFDAIAGRSIAIGHLVKVRQTDGKLVFADFFVSGVVSGMALNAGSPGQVITFIRSGRVDRADWRPITGTEKLEPGKDYYLSAGGVMSTTVPTSLGYLVKVGQAITAESFGLLIHDSIRL